MHPASRGRVLFAERVDRMTIGGQDIVLPRAGVFDMCGGKVAAWRDYLDRATGGSRRP